MKKKIIFLGVFLGTFLIGYFITSFTNLLKLESSETNPIIEQTVEKSFPKPQNEKSSNLKVINVEVSSVKDFWGNFENHRNKHFIEPGAIDKKYSKIKSSEIWLGLFGDFENTYLQQTKVQIKQANKSKLDSDEIKVGSRETPLFLIKDLKKVKAGKVTTLFRGKTWDDVAENEKPNSSIEKRFSRQFKLGERTYTLRVEEGISEKQEPLLVLLLESDGESQIIDYSYDDNFVGDLYWVGDLDSDGKLDLFMDFWNYEKGYHLSGLFISSEAKKGELVKRFEFLAYGGC